MLIFETWEDQMTTKRLSLLLFFLITAAFVSACSTASTPTPTPVPKVFDNVPATGDLTFDAYEFTIPLPDGVAEDKRRDMPGIGVTAIYTAPDMTMAEIEAFFETHVPPQGLASQGIIGPNLTFLNEKYSLTIQFPEDGFLIMTLMERPQNE
jgi:hypothetical protein